MHTNRQHHRRHVQLSRRIAVFATGAVLLWAGVIAPAGAASSWNPTLLVNTESFSTIDDGDGTTDIEIRFGDTLNERIFYDITDHRFTFTRSVHVSGDITATGSLSIQGVMSGAQLRVDSNADIWGNLGVSGATTLDGTVTFGSTVILNDVEYTFPYGDGAASGKVLKTDGAGQLIWADDEDSQFTGTGALQTFFDDRYVNVSGDTMTGGLIVEDDVNIWGNLGVSGTTVIDGATTITDVLHTTGDISTDGNLTINKDNTAADAVLTFGNSAGVETLKFIHGAHRFEFSDDLHVTGALSASGTLHVDGAAVFGSTVTLNGVTYTFPHGDGSASGKVLKTDGAGNLVWATDIDTNTNAATICGAGQYLRGDGSCVDVIEEGELTSESDLETQLGGINVIVETEINTFAKLQTLVADQILLHQSSADNRYVNVAGDTMTGALSVLANISGSTLTVDGDVTIRGQTYSFPTTGGAGGQVLTTDGSGELTWSNQTVGVGSGGVLFLSPEYPHAVYTSSGSAYIGQLSYDWDSTNGENFYHWTSSKGDIQDYWIAIRVRVPDNFNNWSDVAPIQFRYRTAANNASVNHLKVKMLDTAGAVVPLTSAEGLYSNNAWTTAGIAGPEAGGTFTAGSYFTILVKLATTNGGSADAGYINLNWSTSAP